MRPYPDIRHIDRSRHCSAEELVTYEGVFGNYAYGNLTIVLVEEELQLFYGETGHYSLVPGEPEGFFHAFGSNVVSTIRTITDGVQFVSGEDGVIDGVVLGTPETPMFERGLTYEDAPHPEDPYCWQ